MSSLSTPWCYPELELANTFGVIRLGSFGPAKKQSDSFACKFGLLSFPAFGHNGG